MKERLPPGMLIATVKMRGFWKDTWCLEKVGAISNMNTFFLSFFLGEEMAWNAGRWDLVFLKFGVCDICFA